jgi:transposase
MKLNTIAVDIAKNTFYLVGFNNQGKPQWKRKLSRRQFSAFIARQEKSIIAMESCSGAHHWARTFVEQGHGVSLLPPQHVKAYARGQKNDYNDAQAIGEALLHGAIRSVAIKTIEQQDEQAFHRIRRQLKGEQTRIVNQLRGLLAEYGIVIAKGITQASKAIPLILEDANNGLTSKLRELINRQYQRFLDLKEEINYYDQKLETQAKSDDEVKHLMTIPGFGVVNASVFKSWIGDGKTFKRGRDASAALGLVPRQHSTGGKDRLFGITKRGDRYLRALIVHGARSVVSRADTKTDPLSLWIKRLVVQRGFNKAVIALANKMVRIAWALTTTGMDYRPRVAV